MKRAWYIVSFALLIGSTPALGAAKGDAAAAEALFREGTGLAKANRCDEAVPKLLESHRLDPAPGTLLNAARCERKLGRLASAWQHAQDAAALARELGKRDREKAAQTLVTELDGLVPRLRIELPKPVPEGLELVRDDVTLSIAAAGSALPVDPGAHVIRATAPKYKALEKRIDVREGQGIVVVTLDRMEKLPEAPPVVIIPAAVSSSAPVAPVVEASPKKPGGNKTVWLGGLIGAGAAGATGIVAGALVLSGASTLKNDCGGTSCTAEQKSKMNGLNTLATVSTVAFVATGVGVALAAVFWPSKAPVEARVGLGSVEFTGRF